MGKDARDSAIAPWKRFVGAALQAVKKKAIEVELTLAPPSNTRFGLPSN